MLNEQTFGAGEITRFADVTNDNLQNWLKRKVIMGQHDITGGGGIGQRRKFTFNNLMEIAVAAELMACAGLNVSDAFRASKMFSHTGHGPTGFVGEAAQGAERRPGMPYHHDHGTTLLCVWNEGQRVILTDNGLLNINTVLPHGSIATGFVVLDVSEVFARVMNRMGRDYRAVLNEAYEKGE